MHKHVAKEVANVSMSVIKIKVIVKIGLLFQAVYLSLNVSILRGLALRRQAHSHLGRFEHLHVPIGRVLQTLARLVHL